jgi:excisionase family DNA binding protein
MTGNVTATWSVHMNNLLSAPVERAAYSIPEVLTKIGVGRDKLYELIRSGQLPTRKCGRRTIVLATDLQRFLEELPIIGQAA